MARLESYAGGATGLGGTVALRQTMDSKGGLLGEPGTTLDRATRPSVVYGVGSGLLSAALWWLDEKGTDTTPGGIDNAFWATHSLTALPSGAVSALLPVSAQSGDGSTQTVTRKSSMSRRDQQPAGGSAPRDAGGNSNSDYNPAE